MALLPPLDDAALGPDARAVFDDIRQSRQTDYVNDFWRVLAHDPPTLARIWAGAKQVMAPGALDPLVKELVYIAVSVTNNCEYCIHSHIAAARKKGMDDEMLAELVEIVALANAGNRLTQGLQVEVDERFKPKFD